MSIDMHLQVTASLLRRGGSLDRLSTGITLLGALLGLSQYFMTSLEYWGLVCSASLVLLGVLQKYWALRVAFDADLFQNLATDAHHISDRTEALDQALAALRLQSSGRGGRPWNERINGAPKLLRRQALLVAAQVLLTAFFILAGPWLTFTG